jgi:predicted permease
MQEHTVAQFQSRVTRGDDLGQVGNNGSRNLILFLKIFQIRVLVALGFQLSEFAFETARVWNQNISWMVFVDPRFDFGEPL